MKVFSMLFSTRGRTGRLHYFLHGLVEFVVVVLYAAALSVVPAETAVVTVTVLVFSVLLLAEIVSEVCVTVRRLHDLERPGTHWWLLMIPLYNIYLGLVLLFAKGTEGPNRYGEDPVPEGDAVVPGTG